jgi:hypothetical protein
MAVSLFRSPAAVVNASAISVSSARGANQRTMVFNSSESDLRAANSSVAYYAAMVPS